MPTNRLIKSMVPDTVRSNTYFESIQEHALCPDKNTSHRPHPRLEGFAIHKTKIHCWIRCMK